MKSLPQYSAVSSFPSFLGYSAGHAIPPAIVARALFSNIASNFPFPACMARKLCPFLAGFITIFGTEVAFGVDGSGSGSHCVAYWGKQASPRRHNIV